MVINSFLESLKEAVTLLPVIGVIGQRIIWKLLFRIAVHSEQGKGRKIAARRERSFLSAP